jgi:glucose/mannose-6-phosphate isomerase
MTVDLDDRRAVRAADPGDMLGIVRALGSQCREGYAHGVAARGFPDLTDLHGVVVCGMGGSAVAGDVLRSVFRDRLGVPVEVNRSPRLPVHAETQTLVVASSYSGNTSETLSAFEESIRRGCRAIAITSGGALADRAAEHGVPVVAVPGGFQPRAALGWLAFTAIGALEAAGLLPPMAADVEETVEAVEAKAAASAVDVPTAENPAKRAAIDLGDRVPVVWGEEGIGAVAAARWKTQFNENAKIPAWSSSMSELDHNEIVGWTEPYGRSHAVFALRHDGEDPETEERFPLSLRIAADAGAWTEEVRTHARSSLARLLDLISRGDHVSAYVAIRRGVDPTPVEVIQRLKAALAG